MKITVNVFLAAVLVAALLVGAFPAGIEMAQSASDTIVISQVYGGGGNTGATYKNDFIELYNLSSSPVDVSGWSVQYASASGSTWIITNLSGTIQPKKYFLIQQAAGSGGTVDLPAPDVTGTISMSATAGKVALVNNTTALAGSCPTGVVDLVGFGSANCSETAPTAAPSNTTAAVRKLGGAQDTDNNSVDFDILAPDPRNSAWTDDAPAVSATNPPEGGEVHLTADLSLTFSEPVSVSGEWFSLSCSVSGAKTAAVSGGPSVFTLNPDADFAAGDACTLTVFAANISDQDLNDPPNTMDSNTVVSFTAIDVCALEYTPISAIQGSGPSAAVTGTVSTKGIVVGDYEGPSPAQRGFFIQDPAGDDEPNTSDGIFVFDSSNSNNVSLGDVVRVTGTAGENQEQSQISLGAVTRCGTGTVTPTDVSLPLPSADHLERYEGMLVRLPQTLYVTEHFQLGRFGQVVLSASDRLDQPTNVVLPGATATILQAANDLNRIIIDDASQAQNSDPILFARGGQPLSASNTLRGGDTATGIVGVLTYTWGGNSASPNAYRVRPVSALNGTINFAAANPRPASVPEVGGTLKVMGMNVLNYFNGDGLGGGFPTARGANTLQEFTRQRDKIISAILKADADIVGLVEIENDSAGNSSIEDLVSGLNAATAPGTYAFINTGVVGTDAIRVALIYQPAAVAPLGSYAVLDSSVDPDFIDTKNRPSLAQTFEQKANGGRFTVVVNHLKSKGSDCLDVGDPDTGDGQGNCNLTRTKAAQALADWLAADPTGSNDGDFLIIGDMNAYAMEDPITAVKDAGYTNLAPAFLGDGAYSYVFNGQWGSLDHALASSNLVSQVTGAADYHINADEPVVLDYNTEFKTAGQITSLYAADEFRSSDHDPLLIGLNLSSDFPNKLFLPVIVR